jgi:hypothetical protein
MMQSDLIAQISAPATSQLEIVSYLLADFCENMREGDLFAAGMSLGSAYARLNHLVTPSSAQALGWELIEAAKDAEQELARPAQQWTTGPAQFPSHKQQTPRTARRLARGET